MANTEIFRRSLKKADVDEAVIDELTGLDYEHDSDESQDNANYFFTAMRRCEELLGFDKTAEVMYNRSCCKSGFRLKNAVKMARENGGRPLDEKLEILGTLKYMGRPHLDENGDIYLDAVGSPGSENYSCPCWNLNGKLPKAGRMPLSYCLCCAGHFMFHYQKALGLTLRVRKVVSSILNSEGKENCAFIYEITGPAKNRKTKK